MREVILYRQCRHPHILAFLGVSEEPNRFYGLVTPFMKNGNVAQFLKKNPHVNRLTPVGFFISEPHSVLISP
jgi:serine/threonine protein kinase